MSETVYLKISTSVKVNKLHVTLGDVAKIYSKDKCLVQKIKPLKIYTFHNPKKNRIVISAMKVIEIICNHYPNIDVVHIGETDFLLEYQPLKRPCKFIDYIKVAICCVFIFFGSAFTIMTFNTDVSTAEVFKHIYEDVTGLKHTGITPLEISYSVGIALGIIIFYNHFGKKRLSNDPTPVELEMRKYETDIEEAIIAGVSNKEEHIDVD